MSASQLSALIKKHILPALYKDLRPMLDAAIQDIEIDKDTTMANLEKHYKGIGTVRKEQIFNDIIASLNAHPEMHYKDPRDAGGRQFVYTFDRPYSKKKMGKQFVGPTPPLASRYRIVAGWKKKLAGDLEDKWGKRVKGIGKFSSDFHLGHGTRNKSLAAVGYRSVSAVDSLRQDGGAGTEYLVSSILSETTLLDGIDVNLMAETAFDQGRIKKDYTVWLDLQWGKDNVGEQAANEEYANRKLKEFFNRLVDSDTHLRLFALESGASTPVMKYVDAAITAAVLEKKIKGEKKTSKAKAGKRSKTTRKKQRSPKFVARPRDAKGQFTSAMNIQAILNAKIKEEVADNMGKGGALVYRTGRFADSVTVEKVTQSRQGALTAFYTYMKAPYQTFERGFKQGSLRRDPRRLISASIREIAREMLSHKLQIRTRRV